MAIAILGTAILALMQLYSVSLRNTKTAEDYTKAVLAARSMMEEALSAPAPPESEQRDFKDGSQARLSSEVIESSEGLSLYEVTVQVSMPGGKEFAITGRKTVRERQ